MTRPGKPFAIEWRTKKFVPMFPSWNKWSVWKRYERIESMREALKTMKRKEVLFEYREAPLPDRGGVRPPSS